jgi:multiple sugar transport system substrate-binding protein
VALLGCGSDESQSDQTADESANEPVVQLIYQDWREDWLASMVPQMLEQFHAEHPNIRVFYNPDPLTPISSTMLAAMQDGTAPDVFQGCCSFFPIWAQAGFVLDLRSYVESDLDAATIAEWDPAQYQALFTSDGRQYALPKYRGALALYYNKDLFDEYGVAYPDGTWTHDEYLDAMTRLTQDRDGDGRTDLWGSMIDISWDRIQMYINGWGGHMVDPQDPTRCAMGEPRALEAMEWIRARMWDDKVMATFLDVQNLGTQKAFVDGRIAMVEDGSWSLKGILADADFRVGVAPFPAGPVRRVTLATTDGYGIYSGTKHPDAAWELLKFLTGSEYGRALARGDFLQPARASLVDDWAGFIRDEFPDKTRDIEIEAFTYGHTEQYSVTAEIFANQGDAQQLTYDAWEEIFTFGKSPVELMKSICTQIEEAQ